MAAYFTKPLEPATWSDFSALVERHNGVWGGCWCLEFHPEGGERDINRRSAKERRTHEGTTHAALVYDGEQCVGWCQFGSRDELPRIKLKRAYHQGLEHLPDWRITCFFVDKAYRRRGVAAAALRGALQEISQLGGGMVESYPEDTTGRTVASSFLYNGSVAMFEKEGFERVRPIGKTHWVVSKLVNSAATTHT